MHTGIKLNDGKIYTQGEDGNERELGVISGGSVEIEPMEDECTYADINHLGINKGYGITLTPTHKKWYKKKKGGRWIHRYVIKPGFGSLDSLFSQKAIKEFRQYVRQLCGPKKPRGKRIKWVRRYIRYQSFLINNHYTDYTKYCTLDNHDIKVHFPGDDTEYTYKVISK